MHALLWLALVALALTDGFVIGRVTAPVPVVVRAGGACAAALARRAELSDSRPTTDWATFLRIEADNDVRRMC